MNEEKYAYEKQQIRDAERELEAAVDAYKSALQDYSTATEKLVTEIKAFTQKNSGRIRFIKAKG